MTACSCCHDIETSVASPPFALWSQHLRKRQVCQTEGWSSFVTWLATFTLVALLAACGGGGDDGSGEPADPPDAAFVITPAQLEMAVADTGALTTIGAGGASKWTSANPKVATVDATGRVTAVAAGSTVVTAHASAGNRAVAVRVYARSGTGAQATSAAVIAKALADKRITKAQALLYRVYAQFGDRRLPAEFAGAPQAAPDHQLLGEAAAARPGLPDAIDQQLRPFFLPPIDPQSWYASQVQALLPVRVASGLAATKDQTQAVDKTIEVACDMSRKSPFVAHVPSTTSRFKIFYLKLGDPVYDEGQRKLADLVGSLVDEVYEKEKAFLGMKDSEIPNDLTLPKDTRAKDDRGEPCNGGDGAYDIYLAPFAGPQVSGQVVSYLETCRKAPSFMVLNTNSNAFATLMAVGDRADAPAFAKSLLAHEAMHIFQLAIYSAEGCAETKWFDEATAEWAVQYVVPSIPTGEAGAPGLEDGFAKVTGALSHKRRTGTFLANYLYRDHRRSIESMAGSTPGYSSYLFFQYLGEAKVREIFDRVRDDEDPSDPTFIVDAIAKVMDADKSWPKFFASLWNDTTNHVLDFWQKEDQYDFGLADLYNRTEIYADASDELKPVTVDQKGKPNAVFPLLAAANGSLPPRSAAYELLKFTDATVRGVSFHNKLGEQDAARDLSVQAVLKVNGQWGAIEDWTDEPSKTFCRDKPAEHIEEMVLIVSNANRGRIEQDVTIDPDSVQVDTSNACAWDPAKDFSTTTNLAGSVWTYGWLIAPGVDDLALYPRARIISGVAFWDDPQHYVSGVPQVSHSMGGTVTEVQPDWQADPLRTVTWRENEVLLHPGARFYSTLRFTAPLTGNFAVSARFKSRDVVGATTDVYIGRRPFRGAVDQVMPRRVLSVATPSATIQRSVIHLAKGQFLDFVVGPGFADGTPSTDFASDSTGLNASIELVP